jgi:hypothetical protein
MSQDIRVENPRQVSLLGFYGVVPDVDIAIPAFNQPIERLAFYFYSDGEGDGQPHTLTLEVLDPTAHRVLGPIQAGPQGTAPAAPARIVLAVVFTATNLVFRGPGRYQILLTSDDGAQLLFNDTFNVHQAQQGLFELA